MDGCRSSMKVPRVGTGATSGVGTQRSIIEPVVNSRSSDVAFPLATSITNAALPLRAFRRVRF